MKLYLQMLKKPVFALEDVMEGCSNIGTAKNHLTKLVADGYVQRIRKNLYTCISPETGLPVANKYQIASAITKNSFVSHHTALEYYGVADQVYYEVYVSSATKVQEFEYEGFTYKCVSVKNDFQVDAPIMANCVRISSAERNVIESIKDMDKISGIEEIMAALELFPMLDEEKMLDCLDNYNNQFLYQKTGFIMEHYKENFSISDDFISYCKEKSGKSKRYFSNDMMCTRWNKKWQLMIPERLFEIKNGVSEWNLTKEY